MFEFCPTPDFLTRNVPTPRLQQRPRLSWLAAVIVLAGGVFVPSAGFATPPAEINWHPSMKEALAAASSHNRPVLVVFTAEWSPASSQLSKYVLRDPSTTALLEACFEPVLIDVDAKPEVANELGMNQVPGCCIVRADGTVAARFECPTATGQFIATVARNLQQTGGDKILTSQSHDLTSAVTVIAEEIQVSNDFSTAGSLLADAAATGPAAKSVSVNQIAAKVRGLSDFASTTPAVTTSRYASKQSQDFPRTDEMGSVATDTPTMAPRLTTAETQELDRSTVLAESAQAPVPAMPKAPTSAIAAQSTNPASADLDSVVPRSSAKAITGPAPAMTAAVATAQAQTIAQPHQSQQPFGDTAELARSSTEPSMPASQPTTTTVAPWSPEPGHFTSEPKRELVAADRPIPVGPYPSTQPTSPPVPRAVATSPSQSPSGFIEPQPAVPTAQPTTVKPWLAPAPATTLAAEGGESATTGSAWTADSQPEQTAAATAAPAETQPEPKPTNPVLAALQKPFSMFTKKEEVEVESDDAQLAGDMPRQENPAGQANYADYASQKPITPPAEQQATMPLGLEGFCPVSLIEKGSWVEGQAQWGARHRGRTYLFGGLEQQQAFLADPDRYAPALSGDDPVIAFDSGETQSGQRQYGVTYQQRIYLFATPESRTTFAANPQRYTSRVILAEQQSSGGNTILR